MVMHDTLRQSGDLERMQDGKLMKMAFQGDQLHWQTVREKYR